MATKFNHALTPAMIELLRWYAHAPGQRRRLWKKRPHPNKAQKVALLSRGLVSGHVHDLTDEVLLERITTEGSQLLKLVDKAPHAWMPKE